MADMQPGAPSGIAIPDALPVLPLRDGMVIYPMAVAPLLVGQPRSVRLIDDVMSSERMIALVAQRNEDSEQPGPDDLYQIGTAGIIHQLARGPEGTVRIIVQGVERIKLIDFTTTDPYLVARIEPYPDRAVPGVETEALRRAVVDLYQRLIGLMEGLPSEMASVAESLTDPRQVAYLVASTMPLDGAVRQELLEQDPIDGKLRRLIELLQHDISVRELGQRITSETTERMSKAQREFFLREQLRSIQQELGEEGGGEATADLRERLDKASLPPEAKKEAERELARLASIPEASPEHGMVRTYLEWMTDLPWSVETGGEIDVKHARDVLDEDHYDLEKIKDRILEYLSVRKLRQDRGSDLNSTTTIDAETANNGATTSSDAFAAGQRSHEPILCFVGPPGVGKTSLGQSIARALGRKFVHISLGGVHDEAEIRGHRRTYIGAMPGRIIQGLRRVETCDPVFMLDEIDKVGADWRGDPASALLEVLDPSQNNTFVDTYLGVPFDLSKVLFIATGNTLDTIPAPLLDRMEVLTLSGYTEDEKVNIAERYLVPKQVSANGLRHTEISFVSAGVREIVRGYTREAGVRNLERQIATVCRKVGREVAEGKTEPSIIDVEAVHRYLGRPRFFEELTERAERPGIAIGLAWTPTGGDVLFIEATMMPSRDERLVLTGMLGDVMRESAQAALSYVRSNAKELGIDPMVFDGKTIHLHVPAGAIPKDGPSAGVTMMTALASLAVGRKIAPDLAMTGEITLRGRVLPVGGIKEKVLAAHRAGIKTVILPELNERDLEDVPAELREQMEFVPVHDASEVLQRAFQMTGNDFLPERSTDGVGHGSDDEERIAARATNR